VAKVIYTKTPPPGFDHDVWPLVPDLYQDIIHGYMNKNEHRQTDFKLKTSTFGRFWWDPDYDVMEKIESSFNSMALLLALLLTIPFGCFGALNFEYFNSIQEYVDTNCPEIKQYFGRVDETVHRTILNNAAMCMYSSMCGLIMICLFYIFKPVQGFEMRIWCRRNGRVLLGLVGLCCIIDILTVMCLGANLIQWFSAPTSAICGDQPWYGGIMYSGVVGLLLSAAIPICLLSYYKLDSQPEICEDAGSELDET